MQTMPLSHNLDAHILILCVLWVVHVQLPLVRSTGFPSQFSKETSKKLVQDYEMLKISK
jgi:hypothetical protein